MRTAGLASAHSCGLLGGCLLALARIEHGLEHQVGDVNRALEFRNRTLGVLLGLLEVLLDHRDAFNAGALLGGEDLEDLAGFTLMGTGNDNDLIVALDVKFRGHVREPPERAR